MSEAGEGAAETGAGESVTAPLAPGESRAVAPGVTMFAQPVGFPPGAQNAYLLEDVDPEGRPAWTLVDPGLRSEAAAWRARLTGPLAARRLWRVIATHHHPDHIGAAGALQEAFGAALWTTRTAWLFARMLQLDAWETPPPEAEAFHRRAGFDAAMMARYVERAKTNFSVTVSPLPLGFRSLAAGDMVRIGARDWRVAFGQGHAPDHAVLISEADGLVLAGDQALPTISPNIGVYPTEPDADPLGEWLTSCAALAERLPADFLILPGHGDPFRGAPERLRRVIEKHEARLARLEAHLSEPRTVVGCFPALYRRDIPPAAEGLATVETLSHLNHLRARGRITRTSGADGLWWFSQP